MTRPTDTRAPAHLDRADYTLGGHACQCFTGKPRCDCGLYGSVGDAPAEDERDERWTPLQMLISAFCIGLAFWCVVVLVVVRVQGVAP